MASARAQAASSRSSPYRRPRRRMPRHERKPCSGWGLDAMIAATRPAVAGPVRSAQAVMRVGVHSACRRWDSGMCPRTVVNERTFAERGWLATRRPLWNTSTTPAVTRMSHSWPTSWKGTEYQWRSTSTW